MIVVSDATPINILLRLALIDLLPELFGQIVVPPAVAEELSRPQTPEIVRSWMAQAPSWLQIQLPKTIDPSLDPIDAGEREAISLALELGADLLLADDKRARREAAARGLRILGTLGVLQRAGDRGILDLPKAIARLRETDFIIADRLLDDALRRYAKRRRQRPAG